MYLVGGGLRLGTASVASWLITPGNGESGQEYIGVQVLASPDAQGGATTEVKQKDRDTNGG